MELERDCAKVEAARSNRARSTKDISDFLLPIEVMSVCGEAIEQETTTVINRQLAIENRK